MALCPGHADTNPSLSVGVAEDGKLLVHCHAGCPIDVVLQAIGLDRDILKARISPTESARTGRVDPPGWKRREDAVAFVAKQVNGTVEATYDYPGIDGTVRFAVVRVAIPDDKTFRPLHLLNGRWLIGDPKDRLLPLFRLPQIMSEPAVLLVEGEKCVLQSEALGTPATTSAHGARSAGKSDWTTIARKQVIVWPDNDAAGRQYAEAVVGILRQVNPEILVTLIAVDGLPDGGDICDWHDDLVAAGYSHTEIAEQLARLVAAAVPYPEEDSTYSTGSTGPTPSFGEWPEPRPLPDRAAPPPFPIKLAFPPSCEKLRQFVEAVAESIQVPVDLPAMLCLAAFGLATARCYEVEAQRDWREVLGIYVLILLPSGERKSAVFSRMIGPIYEWQRLQAIGMAPNIGDFENNVAVLKEKIRRGRRKAATEDEGEDFDEGLDDLTRELVELERSEPKPPSNVASEATTEAIADMLIENAERGLLASPEGDAIDVMLGRYGQGRPNFGLWLSGHAGDSITIRRKGREPLSLHRPVLCVALAIQPKAAEDLVKSEQAEGRGILARFLYAMPTPRVGYRILMPDAVPTTLIDWYGARLHQLLDAPVPDEPQILRLTPEAGDLFLVSREKVEVELRVGQELAECRAWGSKLSGAILRIAGILHLVGNGGFGDGLINVATMNAALSWAPYLIAHERLVMSEGGEDPQVTIAKKLLAWIRRQSRTDFSESEAFNAVRGSKVQKAGDLIEPLELLVDNGWIRSLPPKPRPPSKAGRPPSPRYGVHPSVLRNSGKAPQNTHNTQNPPGASQADDAAAGGGT